MAKEPGSGDEPVSTGGVANPEEQAKVESNPLTDADDCKYAEAAAPDDKQPLMKNHDHHGGRKRNTSASYTDEADADFTFDSTLGKFAPLIVVVYFFVWVLVFALVEEWDFTKTFYFLTATLTTVGYGDVSPEGDVGKVLFIIFILFGLSLIGFSMGVVVSKLSGLMNREESAFEKCLFGHIDSCIGVYARIALMDFVVLLIVTFVGTIYVVMVEEFSTIDAVYWIVCTYTTVGYGDLSLSEDPGTRWFFVVYIFISVSVAASLIGGFAGLWIKYEQNGMLSGVVEKGVTNNMIKAMDIDGNDEITRDEFLGYMLLKLNICNVDTLDALNDLFDQFDVTGSGVLNSADVAKKQSLSNNEDAN